QIVVLLVAGGGLGEGDDALGGRRLHPEQRARDDLDALGRLVARRLDLEHALDLAQPRLLLARAPELVAQLHRLAAEGEAHDERAGGRGDGERPDGEEGGARAAHGSPPGSPVFAALSALPAFPAPVTRRAARSFALRARAFWAHSSSLGTSGFFVSLAHSGP